jgi:hypothetical protein
VLERNNAHCWDISARSKPLEKHITRWLEYRIGYKEDSKGGIPLSIGHFEVLLQAGDLRIADIGTIQKRNEV